MKENLNNLRIESVLERLHEYAVRLAGQENAAGVQIAALIRILANQYERVFSRPDGEDELPGPRVGLLIRLFYEACHCEVRSSFPANGEIASS